MNFMSSTKFAIHSSAGGHCHNGGLWYGRFGRSIGCRMCGISRWLSHPRTAQALEFDFAIKLLGITFCSTALTHEVFACNLTS